MTDDRHDDDDDDDDRTENAPSHTPIINMCTPIFFLPGDF